MELQPLLERQLQAGEVEVGVLRGRVPPAVAHVDLLVRVHHEEVESIVAVVLEKPDVDVVHPDDARERVLA